MMLLIIEEQLPPPTEVENKSETAVFTSPDCPYQRAQQIASKLSGQASKIAFVRRNACCWLLHPTALPKPILGALFRTAHSECEVYLL